MRAQKDASNAYNTYYYTQTIQISIPNYFF